MSAVLNTCFTVYNLQKGKHMLQKLGFLLRPLFNNYVYTIRWGIGKGFKRKGGMQFIPQITPLRSEEIFLNNLKLQNQIAFDIGGFEGIFSLFFSRAVGVGGKVFTFEPNPINYEKIKVNMHLNAITNVTVFNTAIGDESGTAKLVFDEKLRESGSISTSVDIATANPSNTVLTKEVPIDSIDNLIKMHSIPDPDFIKIDVEGFENDVFAGMCQLVIRKKPRLFIENHAFRFSDAKIKAEYLDKLMLFLSENNYSVSHIETESTVTSQSVHSYNDGHFYAK